MVASGAGVQAILRRIKSGDAEAAYELLKRLPESEQPRLGDEDADGNGSALFWACCKGYADLAALLLARGAPVDSRTCWGATPLHGAADNNRPDVVELLLQHGATPDAQTTCGDTPAHLGAYRGHNEVLRRLARHGADLSVRNHSGANVASEVACGRRLRRHASVVRAADERLLEHATSSAGQQQLRAHHDTESLQSRSIQTLPPRRSSRRRSLIMCDCEASALKYAAHGHHSIATSSIPAAFPPVVRSGADRSAAVVGYDCRSALVGCGLTSR